MQLNYQLAQFFSFIFSYFFKRISFEKFVSPSLGRRCVIATWMSKINAITTSQPNLHYWNDFLFCNSCFHFLLMRTFSQLRCLRSSCLYWNVLNVPRSVHKNQLHDVWRSQRNKTQMHVSKVLSVENKKNYRFNKNHLKTVFVVISFAPKHLPKPDLIFMNVTFQNKNKLSLCIIYIALCSKRWMNWSIHCTCLILVSINFSTW